jgi:Conjugative transposon protein TcpC
MARRALLERSDQLTADDEALQPRQPHSARPDQVMPHWRGAGGRWLVWVARTIAWAALLLIGYRGVLAIIEGPGPSPSRSDNAAPSSSVRSGGTPFPVTEAEAYALEFGHVYLNFSPATAAARSASLASFLPPGYGRSLGRNGAGTQRLLDEQVAAVSVTGKHSAVVTLLAMLSHGKMIELGVPIYAANGGMSVSGQPALLPGPAKAVPSVATPATSDKPTETALQRQLPAFFQAYASGDHATLARFSARGAHIRGLSGEVSLAAVDSVYVPAGGSSRTVVVTVTWDVASATPAKKPAKKVASISAAPAALEMTYQLIVIRQGGSWDIRSIGASTEPLASGPP